MDSLTLICHNPFKTKIIEKTHRFVPRPLIFKLQQKVLKSNHICVCWSSPKLIWRAITENVTDFPFCKTNFPFYGTYIDFLCYKTNPPFKLRITILTFPILKVSGNHSINIYILILIFHNIKLNCYHKTKLLIIILTSVLQDFGLLILILSSVFDKTSIFTSVVTYRPVSLLMFKKGFCVAQT